MTMTTRKEPKPYQISVIPALPEWRLVSPCTDEQSEVCELYFEAIIAWAIEAHEALDGSLFYEVKPITPDGSHEGDGSWAISPPDGKMILPYDRDLGSAEELLAYWKESMRRKEPVTPKTGA